MTAKYRLLTTCVHCAAEDAPAIHAMVETAREITADTFKRRTAWQQVARELGYATSREAGLRLEHDYHVRFHRSTWEGKPCYFMIHSAIEHIFTQTT